MPEDPLLLLPRRLAERFHLGEVTSVAPLRAGSIPLWRLDTTTGRFHVKVWLAFEFDWGIASRAAGAEIERAAVAAGVPTAEPVVLAEWLGPDLVTVHRWVDGGPVTGRETGFARWLGQTLALLHTLPPSPLSPADAIDALYGTHDDEEWADWIQQAMAQDLPWAAIAARELSLVREMDAIARVGRSQGGPLAGTHRDLSGDNILSDGSRFTLVDWDLAGPDHAWLETVRAAVLFGRVIAAGAGGGEKPLAPDLAVVDEILTAYVAAGGQRAIGGWPALAGTMGMQLGRLSYFMWVSLGHRPCTPEERATATDYVTTWFPQSADRMVALRDVAAAL